MDKFLRYIYSNSNYFKDCLEDIRESDLIKLNEFPSDWKRIVSNDNVWINYIPGNIKMEEQGWKLHVSCHRTEIYDVLNTVSRIMFDFRIPFKHIYTRQMFDITHSKNANRIVAGKFITVYPNSDNLQKVLMKLYKELAVFKKGSYILTDKRFKDSNIYYRYGAFKEMIFNGKHSIKDSNGQYVEDKRVPYFHKPDFIDFPDFLEELLNEDDSKDIKTKLSDYDIKSALKFSASGGIYFAERISDKKPVIIKEARNSIGFDSEGLDAIHRLRNEYDILKELKECKSVVNTLDYFKVWENEFLVEDFIAGMPLMKWIAANYPFSVKVDKSEYNNKTFKIMESIEETVNIIHNKNLGISDLQPNNIMIDNDLKCTFIDFESSGDINESYNGLGTHGFSMGISDRRKNDIHAMKKIAKYLLLPISPVDVFDASLDALHLRYINKLFGSNHPLQ